MRFGSIVLILLVGCAKTPATDGATPSATATSADEGCPKDLLAARGTSCKSEGKTCSGGSEVRMLQCSRGTWNELNVPPMPRPPASH